MLRIRGYLKPFRWHEKKITKTSKTCQNGLKNNPLALFEFYVL